MDFQPIHLLILCSFLTLMKLICCFSSYLSLFLFSLLCGVLTVHTVTPAFYLDCSTDTLFAADSCVCIYSTLLFFEL